MPSHCCKRDLGTRGLPRPDISGCGECRIALKGSALEISETEEPTLQRCMANTIVARRALSPSTPRAWRRDPYGQAGVDRPARPSRRGSRCHECRDALARAVSVTAESKNVERRKNLLTGGASYKLTTLVHRASRHKWSEQPCVRPVSAVHVTAGHNALRGSGPGQKARIRQCAGPSGLSRSP